ncbi:MAG: hypothetical protein EP329_11375 [Deltaproteobacteria bacterium]|nr:MAG: hypothetical protein EP329_11375 [Deltaproteobacteria bacterium]
MSPYVVRALRVLAYGAPVGLFLWSARDLPNGPGFLRLALVFLWLYPTVAMHELSHAAAARLLGFRVFGVRHGSGLFLGAVRLLGLRHELHLWPIAGLTRTATDRAADLRRRYFLMVAAGPASHLVVLGGALALGGGALVRELAHAEVGGPAVLAALVWANLMAFVAAMVPVSVDYGGTTAASDGGRLLGIRRRDDAEAARQREALALLDATERLRVGDFDAAAAFLRAALDDPELARSWMLHNALAVSEMSVGRRDEAVVRLEALLARDEVAASRVAVGALRNNLAYARVLAPDLDRSTLDEVDRLSEENLGAVGLGAAKHGTRGAVLARRGELEKARFFLRRAYGQTAEPAGRAANAAWLALALPEEAERWLARARALCPNAPEIALVAELRARDAARAALATPG